MTLEDTSFAFVDIETTGGNAVYDRIIEIAVIVVENNVVTRTWCSMVDPERRVPTMITTLTGITNADLRGAPTFAGIAEELQELLAGKVFVAHNARFDYGFIKNEFRRLEIAWSAKTLCTVRLSRAMFPRFKRHSLDAIIERHGFACEGRHRALDDIKVCVDFWYLCQKERGEEPFRWAIESLLKRPSLPSHLKAKSLEDLPDGTGVYLFYGQGDKPIYIGKSVDLRSRVLSHFSGDHSISKDLEISQRVRHIDYKETVGELGALLLESQLVKKHLPVYNVQLRRVASQCALKVVMGKKGFETVTTAKAAEIVPGEFDALYGIFRGERAAKERLADLCEAYSLCPKVLGVEPTSKGACFSYHLKKCKGACAGEEEAALHNVRLRMALSSMKHRLWPFAGKIGIRETHVLTSKTEVHLIDQWCYLGTYASEEDLRDALERGAELNFNLDNYRIISSFLKSFAASKKKRTAWDIEIIELERKEGKRRKVAAREEEMAWA